ncbi:hypothetical protein [Methylobacterium sp. PvR107]|uniref:hypothetical protein n=1 Tax=Methylobacterium sp. PvR107 TaxID=2806597 RepID=UPI001AE83A9C|nr:hypothetical protein [Methylobacterium sp. PvR107]MBP1181800.1 hypothetical protein [Methylobacterium sp. PvR107]
MRESEPVRVLAATSVRLVEVVDGGDTVAVSLRTAGGDDVERLLPPAVVSDLLSQLASALDRRFEDTDRPPPG